MPRKLHLAHTCIPDEVLNDGIEWENDPAIQRAANELSRRMSRWLRAKEIIDADWRKDAEQRLAAVTTVIERDNLIDDLEAELEADRHADDETVANYLEQFAEIARRANAAWRKRAEEQLRKATAEINRSIARTERKAFEARGLIRGRR